MSHNNQPSYGEVINLAEEAHHAMKHAIFIGDLADARKWSITEDAHRYYAQSLTGAPVVRQSSGPVDCVFNPFEDSRAYIEDTDSSLHKPVHPNIPRRFEGLPNNDPSNVQTSGAAIEVPVNNGYFPGATSQWIGRYNPS